MPNFPAKLFFVPEILENDWTQTIFTSHQQWGNLFIAHLVVDHVNWKGGAILRDSTVLQLTYKGHQGEQYQWVNVRPQGAGALSHSIGEYADADKQIRDMRTSISDIQQWEKELLKKTVYKDVLY